ncbi:MAG: RagB/SusD family nutrient uptake outer membrane protein, partial [Bacteroidota bacterium]
MRHILIILLSGIFLLGSCTELEQEPKSELTNEQFFQTERQILSAIGPAYQQLSYPSNGDLLNSTDITVTPTRGKHWYDGGVHLRKHWHDWNNSEVNSWWSDFYEGISTCNRIQYQIERLEDPSETALDLLKELKGLRAYYTFWAMDYYGNIPLVTDHDVPEDYAPDNEPREEVYNFLISELEEAIPALPEDVSSR